MDHIPQIIGEAAKSTLGLFALMLCILGWIGIVYFRHASEQIRVSMFLLMFVGVAAFGFAVMRSSAGNLLPPKTTPKLDYSNKDNAPTDDSGGLARQTSSLTSPEQLSWAEQSRGGLNWYEAAKYCRDLRQGGHDDWRLPTLREIDWNWMPETASWKIRFSEKGQGFFWTADPGEVPNTGTLFMAAYDKRVIQARADQSTDLYLTVCVR